MRNSLLTRKKGIVATEEEECLTLVAYLEAKKKQGDVVLFTHVANENNMRMGIRVAMHKKRMGLRKGFPDYVVILPTGIRVIEMKRTSGSVTSPEQTEWIELLNHFGIKAKVCRGAGEAIEFLEAEL